MTRFLTAFSFLLFTFQVSSQPLAVDSAITTSSICYNDGTLTLLVSGGTIPYQYSIISGPVLQNVSYPILPDNGSSFASLHWGTYTVQITDSSGNTLLYNVTIPGNYEFPLLTHSVNLNHILVYPSLGLPPYLYSLSGTSPNGPFAFHRTSGTFDSLCNGTYFVRVQDSCGNFYTTIPIVINTPPLSGNEGCFSLAGTDYVSIYVTNTGNPPYSYILKNGSYIAVSDSVPIAIPSSYACPDTIYALDFCGDTFVQVTDCHPLFAEFCSNFSDSSAIITATGGQPPYTYQCLLFDTFNVLLHIITQDSGHFTHLPYRDRDYDYIRLGVTDACGRTSHALEDFYVRFSLSTDCPFDGNAGILLAGDIPGGSTTITCLTCVPQQTISSAGGHFTNLDTGTYTFRVTDGCGETRDFDVHIPTPKDILAAIEFNSCNDVQIYGIYTNQDTITSGVQFTLYNNSGFDSVTTNTTGVFENLVPGSYRVLVQPEICLATNIFFDAPYFAGYCYTPYFDSACQLQLVVKYGPPDLDENYTLVSGNNVWTETPAGADNGIYFNVSPGTYQLVSDSGCSIAQTFNFEFELAENHAVYCTNTADDTLYPQNLSFLTCVTPGFLYTMQNADSVWMDYADINLRGIFEGIPADTFIAGVYLVGAQIAFGSSFITTSNSTCYLDSMTVILPPHIVPYITSANATVCSPTGIADVAFTITGGFAPYDITIPGYPGITTSALAGVLPGIPLGNYTMIISDWCGISSSFSVSVVDSCINCDTLSAAFTVSDTSICIGETVYFENLYSGYTTYQWTTDGNVFSTAASDSFTFTSSGARLIECIMRRYLCRDTFRVTIHVSAGPQFELGSDINVCDTFTQILSSGILNTQWSTGVADSFIAVTSSGLYWGMVSDSCGTFSDSVSIVQRFPPVVALGSDSVLCAGDTLVLRAYTDSAAYLWSTGSIDDSLVISAAGEYSVTVSLFGCMATDSVSFQSISVDEDLLTGDTVLCTGSVVILSPRAGTNPVWQDGSQLSSYTVSDSGVYRVTVVSVCGSISDSVKVGFEPCESQLHIPDAFTPNGDGTNDYFTVFGTRISDYEIRIYNRWGNMVYTSADLSELNNLNRGWDGSYLGSVQQVATFVYYITAKGDDGKKFEEKGNLTLIR